MTCLKCGRETQEEQPFCQLCLADMERYPVKPGTPVQLPNHAAYVAVTKQSWRPSTRENEQIIKLSHRIKRLLFLAILLFLLLAGVTALLVRQLMKPQERPTGQNYSTVTNTDVSHETISPDSQ